MVNWSSLKKMDGRTPEDVYTISSSCKPNNSDEIRNWKNIIDKESPLSLYWDKNE